MAAAPRKGGGIKMTPTKAAQARAMYDQKVYTVQPIAETLGVSIGSIYRRLSDGGATTKQPSTAPS